MYSKDIRSWFNTASSMINADMPVIVSLNKTELASIFVSDSGQGK